MRILASRGPSRIAQRESRIAYFLHRFVPMKIYCPRCAWEPGPHDRWMCLPECGTVWNTFETGGKCPGCGRRWTETCCLACARWSPHEDWYHDDETGADERDAAAEETRRRRVRPQPVEVA